MVEKSFSSPYLYKGVFRAPCVLLQEWCAEHTLPKIAVKKQGLMFNR